MADRRWLARESRRRRLQNESEDEKRSTGWSAAGADGLSAPSCVATGSCRHWLLSNLEWRSGGGDDEKNPIARPQVAELNGEQKPVGRLVHDFWRRADVAFQRWDPLSPLMAAECSMQRHRRRRRKTLVYSCGFRGRRFANLLVDTVRCCRYPVWLRRRFEWHFERSEIKERFIKRGSHAFYGIH